MSFLPYFCYDKNQHICFVYFPLLRARFFLFFFTCHYTWSHLELGVSASLKKESVLLLGKRLRSGPACLPRHPGTYILDVNSQHVAQSKSLPKNQLFFLFFAPTAPELNFAENIFKSYHSSPLELSNESKII